MKPLLLSFLKQKMPLIALRKSLCYLIAFFFTYIGFFINSQAQAPTKLWDRTFGGLSTENPWVIRQTSDGGYIVGGSSFSGVGGDKSQDTQGKNDMWVVKMDADGNKLWDKTFGGSEDDYLYDLQQTSDGGYILVGASNSPISGDKTQATDRTGYAGATDAWFLKIDTNGNKLWDKTIGLGGNEEIYAVQQTTDGGYILGGQINNTRTSVSDYYLIKVDANGNQLWEKSYNWGDNDVIQSLQQTSDGGYILFGRAGTSMGGAWTGMLVKTDANGNKSWQNSFGSRYVGLMVQQTTDGGYIVGLQSVASSNADYLIAKTNATGTELWQKTFGGTENDYLSSVVQTSDGGYIVAGTSFSSISGDRSEALKGIVDFWMVKTDASGTKLWDKAFGGKSTEALVNGKAIQTTDGGYIVSVNSRNGIGGDKSEEGRGSTDFWVIKTEGAKVDLSLTASPATITANKGEIVTYVYTLSNATASVNNVTAKIKIPTGLSLLRATAQQGSYNNNSKIWDVGTMPVGSKTLVLKLKVD